MIEQPQLSVSESSEPDYETRLRDQFAMAYVAGLSREDLEFGEEMANEAYTFANEMMKARRL